MTRPKRPRTRKGKTCRRLLLCLLLLVCFFLLHPIPLTPTQLLRTTEDHWGLAPTEVLAQETISSATLTFSANENVLLVTDFHRLPLPWQPPNPLCLIDLDPQKGPIWTWYLGSDDMDGFRLLGRIDLPNAAAVRVYSLQDSERTQGVQAELLTGPGGHRYLWTTFPRKSQDVSGFSDAPRYAEVLDRSGQVVAICDILYASFFDTL